MALVFGFDVGTTSIGFAAIDFDPDAETGRILRLGARIFPEARDPKGIPLNQTRRRKRLVRRQIRRRRQRRRDLNRLLTEAGLLPSFGSTEWTKLVNPNDPKLGEQPDQLRARGLTEALKPHELGRALYHLAKRRHFAERELAETDAEEVDDDEKDAASARDGLKSHLKKSGETLGQFLAGREPRDRKRGHHATRDIIRDEFEKLWTAQAAHHAVLRDVDFKASFSETMFMQRPVFWRVNTLQTCRLIRGAEPAPKGSWPSIQRRMLEKLNNLGLAGGNQRRLDPEERDAILARLQIQGSMTWAGVREVLKPLFERRGEGTKHLKFNLEEGGERVLIGNPLEAKLADIFGSAWSSHPRRDDLREAAHAWAWAADYGTVGARVVIQSADRRRAGRQAMADRLIADFGVTAEQAAAVASLSHPSGWDAYSRKAIGLLMPELAQGTRFGDLIAAPEFAAWRDATFPDRVQPTGEVLARLPSPADGEERERIATIRNPTVVRVQNELRKVVNNLIDFCGRKPDLIRIELARDIGLSAKERDEKISGQRKQEGRRARAAENLIANGIVGPSSRDIERWLLWKECGQECPYTGLPISFEALFKDNRFEVEHIWPRYRSLDDSFRNKTLCEKAENLRKRNRTPYEAYANDPERWNAIKVRLINMQAKRGGEGMSPGKVRRFLAASMPDDFASRQLNDTGYAARLAAAQLQRLWPDVGPGAPRTVQTANGKVTAHLRRLWGLNNILSSDGEKTRADHRHHAIDALVVACAHPGMSQRLSNYWQAKDDPRRAKLEEPRLDPPWPTIRDAASEAIERVVVSHRVRRKVSGPLHEETFYGDTGQDEVKGRQTSRLFVSRKPLPSVSKSMLEDIRDDQVRAIVNDHVKAHGGDPKKAFAQFPAMSPGGPPIKKVRLLKRQQLALMVKIGTGYADPGANHHMAIFQTDQGVIDYEVVTLFEAMARLRLRQSVVRRDRPGARFVMSLAQGEVLRFEDGESKGLWVVTGVWANGQIILDRINDAAGATTYRPKAASVVKVGARKVAIDPIGRIRPASD
jgi:CRISPR-associated endonuclease Csn1